MKIAMFTDSYFPTIDGVVVSLTSASNELKKRGHEVVICAPRPLDTIPETLPDRVIWLPAKKFGKYHGYRSAIYPSGIVSLIGSEKPDIIHSHGIGFAGIQALVAGRGNSIPSILTYHTMVLDAAPHYSPIPLPLDMTERLVWIFQRNYLRRPGAVITPTDAIRDELIRHGVKAKKWMTIPTGIDSKIFNPSISGDDVRNRLEIGDEKMILSLGRIAREKNLELLLKGFSLLLGKREDIKLVIAGAGPALSDYKSLARKMMLENDVIFTGFVPDEQLPEFYAACDAFAIASTFETQGIVALEAMACGKPVAGINFRAIPELIQHRKNGYLFDNNPESCAEALQMAIEDRDGVAIEARSTAEEFAVEKCIDRLVRLYEELKK